MANSSRPAEETTNLGISDLDKLTQQFEIIYGLIPKGDAVEIKEYKKMLKEVESESKRKISASSEGSASNAAILAKADAISNFLDKFIWPTTDQSRKEAYTNFIRKDYIDIAKLLGYKFIRLVLQIAVAAAIVFAGAQFLATIFPGIMGSQAFNAASGLIDKVKVLFDLTPLAAGALGIGTTTAVGIKFAYNKPVIGPVIHFFDRNLINLFTPYEQLIAEKAEAVRSAM